MPLGLRLQGLRTDGGGEFVSDYYRDNCKTTAIIQQFQLVEHSEENALSERDKCTIMDMVRCMLHATALPKFLWGEMAATAAFLLHYPPNKIIGGDTPYYRVFVKRINLSFLRAIGTHPSQGRQAHIAVTSWHTRSPHHLQSQQQLRAH